MLYGAQPGLRIPRVIGLFLVNEIVSRRTLPLHVFANDLPIFDNEKVVILSDDVIAAIDPFDIFIFLNPPFLIVNRIRFADL